MDLSALLAQIDRIADLTDDELAELRENLRAFGEANTGADASEEMLAEAQQAAEALDAVDAEVERRSEEEQARAERAAGLAERFRQEEAEEEPEGDPAETEEEEPEETEEVETPQQIAASGRRAAPIRANARRRVPEGHRPGERPRSMQPAAQEFRDFGLVASANVPGTPPGTRFENPRDLGEAILAAYQQGIRGARGGGQPVKVPVARTAPVSFGEDRTLGRDPVINQRRIAAVTSDEAIVAAGGICAPAEINYDFPIIGSDARPLRDDGLARFGAERGGVKTFPPPIITDLDGAIDLWTEANDQNPSDPTVKPCLTVDCPDEDETLVDAITRCLEFGNFRARFWPEQVDAYVRLAAVRQARFAEVTHLAAISTGSTALTAVNDEGLSSTRDTLAIIDRLTAGFQSRHRTGRMQRLRWLIPEWWLHMTRTDLARELPGSTDERLAMADSQIEAFFAARPVNVTWLMDGPSGQIFTTQNVGALNKWPDSIVMWAFQEGAWLFLDGGELDLGLVRDSSLNETNDFRLFAETFEGVHFHGVESFQITADICPDGSTASARDFDPCTSGS